MDVRKLATPSRVVAIEDTSERLYEWHGDDGEYVEIETCNGVAEFMIKRPNEDAVHFELDVARPELDRLRAGIEAAPHASGCDKVLTLDSDNYEPMALDENVPCSCWKHALLEPQA